MNNSKTIDVIKLQGTECIILINEWSTMELFYTLTYETLLTLKSKVQLIFRVVEYSNRVTVFLHK